jgi:soluble lytic murein transglycosylase-like protein
MQAPGGEPHLDLRRTRGWEVHPEVARRGAAALLAGLVGLLPPAACAAESLQDYQAQADAVQAQLAAAQAEYSAALQAWRAALQRLQAAEQALRAGADRLAQLTQQVQQAQAELVRRQQAVRAQQAVVAADQQRADRGLVVIDEHGSVSFLGVLLGATSFSDFLTRLTLLEKIWGMEVGLLRQARASAARLAELERQQAQQVAELGQLQQQAAQQVVLLRDQQQRAAQAKADADQAVARADRAVQSLLAQRSALEAKIQALLAAMRAGKVSWAEVQRDIQQLASAYGIDPLLVEAVVLQESGGNPNAQSSAGAVGLMQLMPNTAAALGVSDVFDPVQNLRGGIEYLLQMLNKFHGNLALALAAYNAGPYAVEKYGGIPPYQETQNYVNDVLAIYNRERAAAGG